MRNMFHVKHCSDSQQKLLSAFVSLVLKWNAKINLIGRSTEDEIWQRHIIDSGQIVSLITSKNMTVCDLGTGSGFPGIVLCILGVKNMTLIEADQKKCVFLREARRALDLEVEIIESRMEEIKGRHFDFIVSRAVASITRLFELSIDKLKEGSTVILFKGKTYQREIDEASSRWSFEYKVHPSQTNAEGVVIVFNHIKKI